MAYQIRPNNKLSNHFIKKNLRKVEFTFAEDYDCQTISHPNNPIIYPSINASLQTNQHLTFSNCGDINFHLLNSCSSDNYLTTNNFGGDVKSLGNIVSPMSSDNWGIDGDGLTDGQEVNGWTVMVAYQVGDTMETKERIYKTNPTLNQSGSLDSDQDGLSDWTESSIAGLNYTAKLISGSISVSYYLSSDLKATYGWYIDKCIKEAKSEAGTNLIKFNSTLSDKLNSQFSPYIRENIPPKIHSIDIWTEETGDWWSREYWTRVIACVEDFTGLKHIYIDVVGHQWSDYYAGKYGFTETSVGYAVAVNIGWWAAKVSGYDVKVGVEDLGGNKVEVIRSCGTWWTEFASWVEGGLDWTTKPGYADLKDAIGQY